MYNNRNESDVKELIKTTVVNSTIFLVTTILLAYLFVRIFKMDTFVSEIIIIVIIIVAIVYVDQKRIRDRRKTLKNSYAYRKVLEHSNKMIKELLK